MATIQQIPIDPASPERFRALLGEDYSQVERAVLSAGENLAGRVVWHVNSTARGGGVAEMLQSLLAYARGAGVDARWATIAGSDGFFRVTKRIHNHLHGANGDGGPLGRGGAKDLRGGPRARTPMDSRRWCAPATSSISTTPRRPG